MSLSIFGEKALVPNEEMLAGALAGSKAWWNRVSSHVEAACGNVRAEWKYYTKKAGWTLVVKSGERTILYLIPLEGCFKASFVFGEKAVAAAQNAGLPAEVAALISEAKPYVEGRSFMIDVQTEADVDIAFKLIESFVRADE